MNTLNGYSKSRLSNNEILTAAGGHIPQQLVNINPQRNFDLLYDTTPMLMNGVSLGNSSEIVVAPSLGDQIDHQPPFGKVWKCSGEITWVSEETLCLTPGEIICMESWIMRPSGFTGSNGPFYLGIKRKDKNDNYVSGNDGTVYPDEFTNFYCPQDNVWYKRYGEITIPHSHTSYSGSDGKGVYYGKVRLHINYNGGTLPTYFGGFRIYRKQKAS